MAVRRAVGIGGLELHGAVRRAEAQAGQGVDRQSQAVDADKIAAPLGGLIAEGIGQERLPVRAAQFALDRAGQLQHIARRPLRQHAGMDHQETVLEDRQRLVPQPVDQRIAVGGAEDVVEGVPLAQLAHAGGDRQQVDVVVAQHRAGPSALAQHDDPSQRAERIRPAVDQVADEAQRGVGRQCGQQGLEGRAAALEIADGVRRDRRDCHVCCGSLIATGWDGGVSTVTTRYKKIDRIGRAYPGVG